MASKISTPYSGMMQGLRAAFRTGKTKTYDWRIEQLNALLKMVRDNEDALQNALKKDLNKCVFEAQVFELSMVYKDLSQTIDNLHTWMKPVRVKKDLMTMMDDCYVRAEPFGTVLIISPWNYPVQLTFLAMVGAIAAGNCLVVKPSEVAPATSEVVADLIARYLDQECIKVVQGGVPETQQLLEEKFDLIMYTGSTTVGKIIMQAAAKHLTPVILELGGKSPVFVDENCDFDVVANRIVWGKCMNSGQTCIAPDYVLCKPETQGKLLESMKKSITSFFGENPQESDSYCRMINSRHFDRVVDLLEKSGKVAIGGSHDAKDKYISPTVLTDVQLDDPIMQDEIFGPVLPIVNVNSVDEAINIINDRDKPLTMYVFSKDQKTVDKIMTNTSSGSFLSNDTIVIVTVLSMPFGGVGASGMGCYHGKYSFDSFSHQRSVMMKSQGLEAINQVRYPPFSLKAMNLIMKWLIKTSPSGRCFRLFSKFCLMAAAVAALAVYLGTK